MLLELGEQERERETLFFYFSLSLSHFPVFLSLIVGNALTLSLPLSLPSQKSRSRSYETKLNLACHIFSSGDIFCKSFAILFVFWNSSPDQTQNRHKEEKNGNGTCAPSTLATQLTQLKTQLHSTHNEFQEKYHVHDHHPHPPRPRFNMYCIMCDIMRNGRAIAMLNFFFLYAKANWEGSIPILSTFIPSSSTINKISPGKSIIITLSVSYILYICTHAISTPAQLYSPFAFASAHPLRRKKEPENHI